MEIIKKRQIGTDESWCDIWAICPQSVSNMADDDIFDALNAGAFYGGPGAAFGRLPSIRRSKNVVIVRQWKGVDI